MIGTQARRLLRSPRIIGIGYTEPGRWNKTPGELSKQALNNALNEANLNINELQGLITIPSLSHERFMQAHYLATHLNLFPNPSLLLRTIDTGGAGKFFLFFNEMHDSIFEGCK